MRHAVELSRATCHDGDAAGRGEWLVTNGLGGYAMGTISGQLCRAYHGYLVAALAPPLGRTLLLAKLEDAVTIRGRSYALSTNTWTSGAVTPKGYSRLERFELDGTSPVWTYVIEDAVLEKRLWMARDENTTHVRYRLLSGGEAVNLVVTPLVGHRSHHGRSYAGEELEVERDESGFVVRGPGDAARLRLIADRGTAPGAETWWRGFHLEREAERGLDAEEDHLAVGRFEAVLSIGDALTVTASVADEVEGADQSLAATRDHERALLAAAPTALSDDPRLRQLVLAADQMLARRGTGWTVLAGYPWFGDWGRDTMIALPGLTLATGRREIAREILITWGGFIDRGMIPNRFPAASEPPEYNAADATLWYVEALRAYVGQTDDLATAEELYPVLEDVLGHHEHGTRHGIGVDEGDGLLCAGESGFQLTWMDARVGERVVTPRIGKPVEINALYYGALRTAADLSRRLGRDGRAYAAQAERVRRSFEKYWNAERGYLFDVLEGPDGNDPRLRPNQIFAASLHHSPIGIERKGAVLDACARSLWTPMGLRSLAPSEPGYEPRFAGPPAARDSAYHQGTVWGFLLGPFASAHYAVHGDAKAARRTLEPMLGQLLEHGLGTLSEVFEPQAPFAPRGCIAQAWSVAELLRAWVELSSAS